ncbi:MAG: DUF6709 family protein [Candidatus Acidiferrales bacterium]
MWNGFIGQRIAATTKTLRHVGLGLLLVGVFLGLLCATTLVKVLRGPAQISESDLLGMNGGSFDMRSYATVEGRDTLSTGITSILKTTRDGGVESETTTGEYMAMVVGKHILVVKARPGQIAQKYTGTIVPLPDNLKKELFSVGSDPDLQAATLSIMLDTTDTHGDGITFLYIIVGLLILSGLWATFQSTRRAESPERHPLCKALSKYGPPYSLVPQIDAEVSAAAATLGNATFTRSWIISCYLGRSFVMRRDEIVWIYKKRTRHSVNFIPTGTTYALVLRDARGKQLEISNAEENVNNFLSSLAAQTPWVIFGYDQKLKKLYDGRRNEFVEAVSERRRELEASRT